MLVQNLPPSVGEVGAERRELGPPHVQLGLYSWSRHVSESCSGLPGCFNDSQLRALSVRPRLMVAVWESRTCHPGTIRRLDRSDRLTCNACCSHSR